MKADVCDACKEKIAALTCFECEKEFCSECHKESFPGFIAAKKEICIDCSRKILNRHIALKAKGKNK